jgi:hypothetical protein
MRLSLTLWACSLCGCAPNLSVSRFLPSTARTLRAPTARTIQKLHDLVAGVIRSSAASLEMVDFVPHSELATLHTMAALALCPKLSRFQDLEVAAPPSSYNSLLLNLASECRNINWLDLGQHIGKRAPGETPITPLTPSESAVAPTSLTLPSTSRSSAQVCMLCGVLLASPCFTGTPARAGLPLHSLRLSSTAACVETLNALSSCTLLEVLT